MRQKKIKNVLLLILFVIATLGAHAQSHGKKIVVQHQWVDNCCISEMESEEEEESELYPWAGWNLSPGWGEYLKKSKPTTTSNQTNTLNTINLTPIISTPVFRITENTLLIMDLNTGKNEFVFFFPQSGINIFE